MTKVVTLSVILFISASVRAHENVAIHVGERIHALDFLLYPMDFLHGGATFWLETTSAKHCFAQGGGYMQIVSIDRRTQRALLSFKRVGSKKAANGTQCSTGIKTYISLDRLENMEHSVFVRDTKRDGLAVGKTVEVRSPFWLDSIRHRFVNNFPARIETCITSVGGKLKVLQFAHDNKILVKYTSPGLLERIFSTKKWRHDNDRCESGIELFADASLLEKQM